MLSKPASPPAAAAPATPDALPPAQGDTARATWLDALAGLGLGCLLGLLMGLSTSAVVGVVIAGIVALLAGVFGLADKLAPGGMGRPALLRLAAFGLSASLVAPLAVYVRSHELLAPSVAQQRQQLQDMGIQREEELRDAMRLLRLGLLPAGTTAVGQDAEATRQAVALRQGVLYNQAPAPWCAGLRRLLDDGRPAADLLTWLDTGTDTARRAADKLRALPPGDQRDAAARAAPLYLCQE